MAPTFDILVMPGEGIGPETIAAALPILDQALRASGRSARVRELEVGAPAYAKTGSYFPPDVERAVDQLAGSPTAAILFGAVADEPIGILRKRYDLFANLRPIRAIPALADVSPLRRPLAEGVDMVIVRELVSDIYYGRATEGERNGERWAAQEMVYSAHEVRRILVTALELAASRRARLTFVHKKNVIQGVFGLWSDILNELAPAFPQVEVSDLHVDNAAMQMMLRPRTFDVIVSSNLFGDILSEVGAGVVGSLGLLPSASRNEAGFALYEPVGGTAPDIAGKGIANPVAAILSVAMLCRYTLGEPEIAERIHDAVDEALAQHRTPDVAEPGRTTVSTSELGAIIGAELERRIPSGASRRHA